MPVRNRVLQLTRVLLCAVVLIGCTVGPSSRPDLAVYGDSGDGAASAPASSFPIGPGGPGQQAELDPNWGACVNLDPAAGAAGNFEVTCAGLTVPLDYADPKNSTIRLDVARARSAGLPADAPTLVVQVGNGPYDATLASVRRLANIAASIPAAITSKFQIVGFDIRGSGGSSNANCFRDYPLEYLYTVDADLTAAGAGAQLLDVTRAFTFGCQDYVGAEMVFYGTTQVADDLDSLRSALGTDTLNFLGIGYGATLGAVYASRYPGRVGRFALDSPVDHAVKPTDRAVASAAQYERGLQAFVADCAAKPPCALGAAPMDTINTAIAGLRYDPTSSTDDWYLGPSSVLWALVMALPDQDRWPTLATTIADTAGGDPGALRSLLESLLDDPRGSLSTRLMLECNDSDERIADTDLTTRLSDAKSSAPLFGPFLVGLASLCRQWPSPDSPLGPLRAQGAAPILVIGGVNDPVAPYQGAQALANQLTSATLISYQATDHGGYLRSTCVADAVNGFLLDATPPAAGTLCPA